MHLQKVGACNVAFDVFIPNLFRIFMQKKTYTYTGRKSEAIKNWYYLEKVKQ